MNFRKFKLPDLSLKAKRIIALSICLGILALAVFQSVRMGVVNKGDGEQGLEAGNVNVSGDAVNEDQDMEDMGFKVVDDGPEYFSNLRLGRMESRSRESEECMDIISSITSSESDIAYANARIETLSLMSEMETQLESSILARGYEDVYVELNPEGDVEISVLTDEINENEVMTIASMAMEKLQVEIDHIVVVAVK